MGKSWRRGRARSLENRLADGQPIPTVRWPRIVFGPQGFWEFRRFGRRPELRRQKFSADDTKNALKLETLFSRRLVIGFWGIAH